MLGIVSKDKALRIAYETIKSIGEVPDDLTRENLKIDINAKSEIGISYDIYIDYDTTKWDPESIYVRVTISYENEMCLVQVYKRVEEIKYPA